MLKSIILFYTQPLQLLNIYTSIMHLIAHDKHTYIHNHNKLLYIVILSHYHAQTHTHSLLNPFGNNLYNPYFYTILQAYICFLSLSVTTCSQHTVTYLCDILINIIIS